MAKYRITAPDGATYEVTAPDGASQDEVLSYAKANYSKPTREQIAAKVDADPISQGARNFTDDMGVMETFNAGVGKAVSDLMLGAKQKLGMAGTGDVVESRRLDAPLMKSGAGMAGNIAGNVSMIAPAALVPGAATVPGAAAISGIIGAMQPHASTAEAFINPAVAAAGGAAGQWIGNKAAGSVAFQQAEAAKKVAQNAQKVTAARDASAAGYVIPPEDIGGGAVTKVLSGVGGKIKTAQEASARNQQVTNKLARQALGVPDDVPLNTDTLNAIRQQAGQAYDVIKGSGTVAADATYSKTLDDIATKYTTTAQAFPGAVKSPIPDLVAALKQPSFSADAAVDMTKILRSNADAAFAQGDKGLGKANKAAADALEAMLERHLQAAGNPQALDAFRKARQTIAKTYSVQKALNPETGDVAANALAGLLKRDKPLSGELRTIAQTGTAFPKATQALKEAPKTWSPLDMVVAGSTAVGTGNPLALGMLGARPAARSIMLSGPAQRNMLQKASTPEQANALLRLMSNNELMLPAGVTAGNMLARQLAQ